jgi:outer membrane protein
MKKTFLIACMVMIASIAMAQEMKIGYVDSQRIFDQSPEYQDAQAKFDKDVESWNTQAEQMRKDIEGMQKELESQSLILSADKKKEKELSLTAKQDTLNQFLSATFGTSGKAEKRMAELSKPIRDRVLEVIEKIAIENNYSLIFDAGTVNIAYAKKSLDITDEVLSEMTTQK